MAERVVLYDGRKVVSINAACMLAGVSRRTIYNWMNKGKVQFVRNAGGKRRIYLDTLFKEKELESLTAK